MSRNKLTLADKQMLADVKRKLWYAIADFAATLKQHYASHPVRQCQATHGLMCNNVGYAGLWRNLDIQMAAIKDHLRTRG